MSCSEKAVILAALAEYTSCDLGDYNVKCWPDTLKKNRNHKEIDAITIAPDRHNLAIEHTRIQSFCNQLMDDALIRNFCDPLAKEIASAVPPGISCTIPIIAFVNNFSWKKSKETIRDSIIQKCQEIPIGFSRYEIEGVPIKITFFFKPSRRTPFFFLREAPSNSQIDRDLLASMEIALNHKKDRLKEYMEKNYETVLIIESSDLALINHVDVYQAYLKAEKTIGSEHLNTILFANTANLTNAEWLCFKGPQKLMQHLNPSNFQIGPEYTQYWEENHTIDE